MPVLLLKNKYTGIPIFRLQYSLKNPVDFSGKGWFPGTSDIVKLLFRQLSACLSDKSNIKWAVGNGFPKLSPCNLFSQETTLPITWSSLEGVLFSRTLLLRHGEAKTILQSTPSVYSRSFKQGVKGPSTLKLLPVKIKQILIFNHCAHGETQYAAAKLERGRDCRASPAPVRACLLILPSKWTAGILRFIHSAHQTSHPGRTNIYYSGNGKQEVLRTI